MYLGTNLVDFPSDIQPVTRVSSSVIGLTVNPPFENSMARVTGEPRTSPSKFITEYFLPRDKYYRIGSVGFKVTESFENEALSLDITDMLRTTEMKASGNYSLRTKRIRASQRTDGYLKLALEKDTLVTFKYTVSSEGNYDWFTMFLNNSQIFRISGSPAWATFSRTLPVGEHTFNFRYNKDGSYDRGYDGGFIDDFTLDTGLTGAKYLVKYEGKLYSKVSGNWEEVPGDTYLALDTSGMTDFNLVTDNDPWIKGKEFSIVTLTDRREDLLFMGGFSLLYRYKIKLGDKDMTAWSAPSLLPSTDLVRVFAADMEGAEKKNLTVAYDISGKEYTESVPIIIDKNSPPTVAIKQEGQDFEITLDDPDGDLVKYRVLMNGTQVFPLNDADPVLGSVPTVYLRSFLSSELKPGENNELVVEAEDFFGATTRVRHVFFARYIGLMFHDDNHQYYSTDLGEVLKMLFMQPKIIAGASTLPSKVYVTNEYTFPVTDVKLYSDDMPENTKVVFSKELEPFTANDVLDMGDTVYNVNEGFYFYVRVQSHHSALTGGAFQIVVEAKGED